MKPKQINTLVDRIVYVASISTANGNDLFVHATSEGLTDALYKFVSDYWEKSMGRKPTKNKEKAIDKYFEYMADFDEYLEWRGPITINE